MILTREITIKITESNYQYYEDMGYDTSIGEDLVIPIELLSKGSHFKIKCKCDGEECGREKEVIFKNYVKYNNKWGEYYCRKCSESKRKKSLQENYGVDYPIQNKKVLIKMRTTITNRQ
jgi:late competence protein required for DNA uptake (superfamily II DNA/RNA helicase)